MKRLILTLLFSSQLLLAWAQNQIPADTVGLRLSDTTQIILPDSITILTHGTKALFTTDTLDVEVSGLTDSILGSPLSEAQVLMATLDAGRTASTLDVSASGGTTYMLPFSLPPGINGIVPQLGLSYTSQGGYGIAGYGWNVYGLSSITRVGAALYADDRIGGVNFDLNDRFALDGQRLLLKSGTYGGDGAEYQTEQYSNLKIISKGVSPYGAGYGPAYFEVHFPDGSKAFFGETTDSRSQMQYAITYVENPQDVRISYEYITEGNNLYISKVLYGTRGTTPGMNRIEFSYETASRAEQNYVGGTGFYTDQRISKISVISTGTNYRHYVPTYSTVATLNYQRMSQIQEFDGTETRALAPINFSYNTTTNLVASQTISNLGMGGIAANNARVLTADFTGSGRMDFLLHRANNQNYVWAFFDLDPSSPYQTWADSIYTGTFLDLFPVTWLTWNEKVLTGQGLLLTRDNGYNKYKFDVYSSGTVTPLYYQYTKLWDDPPLTSYYSNCDNMWHDGVAREFEFVSGDFNGDGLTDIMGISKNQTVVVGEYPSSFPPYDCEQEFGNAGSIAFFIDMDRRKTSDYITQSNMAPFFEEGDKLHTADFNGDGKTDVLIVKNGSMHVFSLNDDNYLEREWFTTDTRITTDNSLPMLLGDYNGDGKVDVMFAIWPNNNRFATFMSTGLGFVKHEKQEQFFNYQDTWDGVNTLTQHFLIPSDIDNDGKTDIVYSRTTTYNSTATGYIYTETHHNIGVNNDNEPVFGTPFGTTVLGNVRHFPVPIFLNPDRRNPDLEYGYISDSTITLFRFLKDMLKESQIAQIQHDGITDHINYSRLMADTYENNIQLYQSFYDQTFPYIDIHYAPQLYVVNKLTRTTGGNTSQQIFGYANAVSNAEGLGFLGFGETIRSNAHLNSSDLNLTFTLGIQSPQLRGANLRTFVSKSSYISPSIRDMELSNPPPVGGVPDGASLSDYISRQDQVYHTDTLPNKTFVNVPIATSAKDMLTGTYQNQRLQYDSFYNLTHHWSDINGTSSKRSGFTFDNSTDTTYYIGRLLAQKDTLQNSSDTYTTEAQYAYTGYLPTEIKNKGHDTDFVIDSLTYDVFGNVTELKTTVPGGAQRLETTQYEPSGRFLERIGYQDGTFTRYEYDYVKGVVYEKIRFGMSEIYTHDAWGKLISWYDYTWNQGYITYSRVGVGNTQIHETPPTGQETWTMINPLGQTEEVLEKTVEGTQIGRSWVYDIYGRRIAESTPSEGIVYDQWNTTSYDPYGRTSQIQLYTGKTETYTYSGLTTTANDGIKSMVTVREATGEVASVQDPGGTVNYSYFANGNLKSADYGGSIQTIEQDGWGRKTKLTDPSAGVYQYSYDGWGQVVTETTPKGSTQFTYDIEGKVTNASITGDGANMQQSYSYDPFTKMLITDSLINADGNNIVHNYSYDNYRRPLSSVEDNSMAIFERSYTYDAFGRLDVETVAAEEKDTGLQSSTGWKNHYANGYLERITQQGTGELIWRIDSLNARGLTTETSFGNNQKTYFFYDWEGYQRERRMVRTSGTPTVLLSLSTDYFSSRGFPEWRHNSAFNWNEGFTYDNLDRLTVFNDGNGSHSQQYDARGRIVNSSSQGIYSYTGDSYLQDELALNPTADAYYQDRNSQNISFNAFKRPIEIHEQGHDRISFQYNGALGRSHMYYGGEQEDRLERRYRRHYAQDGSAEITRDTETGEVSFVLYMTGDPYSAPAIWKVVQDSTSSNAQLYYLHRDYLGSIMMITDSTGVVVEYRHFDAWGNIVKLTDGSSNPLDKFVILDRGYTGHEHLLGVGLINMNGRLYDPRLHRMLSPDNFVQDPYGTQNFNRYGYVLNNPLIYVDENGEFFFIPVIIGAVVGAYIGGSIANEGQLNPFKWDYSSGKTWGYMLGGAAIGGVSGLAGAAVTSSLGTSIHAAYGGIIATGMGSATAGAISGGGFALLTGDKVFEGLWKGAVSGLAGGVVGGYITGGIGAFAGSASSGAVGTILNGGDFNEILFSAIIGGGISYAAYQLQSALNYRAYKQTGGTLTRKQFNVISRSAQKSFTRGREYGGWLTADGGVEMFPQGSKAQMQPQAKPSGSTGFFHTHPNTGSNWVEIHSPADISFNNNYAKGLSLVVGRQNVYMHLPNNNPFRLYSNRIFNPYPLYSYYFLFN